MGTTEQSISFTAAGAERPGFLVTPEGDGPFPGVIVIHEIVGLNENIRDVCRRFAAEGYAALAVDLFAGRNRAVCMFRLMSGSRGGKLDRYGMDELRAALDHLASMPLVDASRLGAIGFCMGGGYAIAWAITDDRLKVIAPFYGLNPKPLEAVARCCPVVGSYPARDFTAPGARALDEELDRHGIRHDIKVYPGALHSFFNDRGRTHDPAASADAWERVKTFFAAELGTAG